MGFVSSTKDFSIGLEQQFTDILIIWCAAKELLTDVFSGYHRVNISLLVANSLLKFSSDHRRYHVVEVIEEILNGLKDELIIIDHIDLLFSPEYSLDVIKLFEQVGKNKRLVIVWGGNFQNSLLTYAEPGYPDYHCYDITNYDICCITN